jgi:hypothetical protein
MPPIHRQSDDIVIIRRTGTEAGSGRVVEVFAITYPGHTDIGTECRTSKGADRKGRALARERRVTLWYEDGLIAGTGELVESFRPERLDGADA